MLSKFSLCNHPVVFLVQRCERGTALIEFAIIVPIIILMVVFTLEIRSYASCTQKVTHATSTLALAISQQQYVTKTELKKWVDSFPAMVAPCQSAESGFQVIYAQRTGVGPYIIGWQESIGNTASLNRIKSGNTINVHTPLESDTGIIVLEAFYKHLDVFNIPDMLWPKEVYSRFVIKPRYGMLQINE